MIEKYKIKKNFEMCTFGLNKFQNGTELNIKDNIVMDGCIKMFHKNCNFAKEHGEVVKRIF